MKRGILFFLNCGNRVFKTIIEMQKPIIDKAFGREAFGLDPAGYNNARPAYPEWVYELLCERCGLRQNVATFEIGAGTGIATHRLLDLGFCATAFHWLDEGTALTKVADLLTPGGWWVMVWNDFGDPDRADPFHEATKLLLNGPSSPSMGDRDIPFSQDKDARLSALEHTHAFESIEHRASAWSLILDPDQVVNLYSTYSNINIRPDRETVLAELRRIARDKFQCRVTRNMVTSLYMARRV
jgi:hypothetical protein